MHTHDEQINPLPFTGERYVPEKKGDIQLEHLHRYALACEFANDKVVLDIACGEGYGSAMLAKTAKMVIGVDISEETIAHALKKYNSDNVQFKIGSCDQIPLPDASVDFVVSFETIEHHDKHDAMMFEIKRVLKPDGLVLISSPDKHQYSEVPVKNNVHHKKELYYDEFKFLLSKYFDKLSIWGQRIIFGSGIFPEVDESVIVSYDVSELVADHQKARFKGISKPVYFLALASDTELPQAVGGILEQPIHETSFFLELIKKRALVEEFKKIIAQKDNALLESKSVIAEKERIIVHKDKALLESKSVVADKEWRIVEIEKDNASVKQAIEKLNQELFTVYTSRSWRCTAPLRKIGKMIQRLIKIPHAPGSRRIIKRAYFLLPKSIRGIGTIENLKERFKNHDA